MNRAGKNAIGVGHYGKNALVIFRVVGCCVIFFSLMGVLYNIAYPLLMGSDKMPRGVTAANVFSSVTYLIAGLLLYFLSKPLASLITRGLRED